MFEVDVRRPGKFSVTLRFPDDSMWAEVLARCEREFGDAEALPVFRAAPVRPAKKRGRK